MCKYFLIILSILLPLLVGCNKISPDKEGEVCDPKKATKIPRTVT
ncbi:MAG: hypothetical protein ACD_16C00165G0006 [uncultured bacterium]|nr:MAG: hypothetical protein ACD_16C00165G0006 [uncultured bacterium]